ncbi:MAG: AAA family ATPase, partial [Thermodesulfobacteriota bacterium]
MKIRELNIRGLKSLDVLDLEFEKKVTLIYGQNGMGKTTVLEAISLLGHLTTMRRVETTGKTEVNIQPSLLLTELRNDFKRGEDEKSFVSELKLDPLMLSDGVEDQKFNELLRKAFLQWDKGELNDWFKGYTRIGQEAVIRYVIEIDVNREKKLLTLFILFKDRNDYSITRTLGRKSYDDIRMNNSYALIWEGKNKEDKESVEKILTHQLRSSPFLIPCQAYIQQKVKENLVDLQSALQRGSIKDAKKVLPQIAQQLDSGDEDSDFNRAHIIVRH